MVSVDGDKSTPVVGCVVDVHPVLTAQIAAKKSRLPKKNFNEHLPKITMN
jgi:hypothetical protein